MRACAHGCASRGFITWGTDDGFVINLDDSNLLKSLAIRFIFVSINKNDSCVQLLYIGLHIRAWDPCVGIEY